jgi:hypothetical protein
MPNKGCRQMGVRLHDGHAHVACRLDACACEGAEFQRGWQGVVALGQFEKIGQAASVGCAALLHVWHHRSGLSCAVAGMFYILGMAVCCWLQPEALDSMRSVLIGSS